MATPINSPRSRPEIDKPLPHSLEAERAILGAIVLDNGALEIALRYCTAADFFLPQNRYIIRAMVEIQKQQTPVDTITLLSWLEKHEQLEAAGGVPYLSQLPDGLPRATNVEHYAKIVAEKAALRRLIYETHDVQQKALAGGTEISDLQRQLAAAAAAQAKVNGNGQRVDFGLLDFLAHEFPVPEHLIGGITPRGGSVLIVAMPHHLKSWFTLALALGSTVAGTLMGKLEVPKPVRTYIASIEDPGGTLQWRIKQLLASRTFADVDPALVRVWPRSEGAFDLMDEQTFQTFCRKVKEHRADHVILDVLRRIFRGDINSPKESAALCEQFDRLRDITGAALTVVHHENRKEADIMRAAAGSFNFPGWANVVIQFKRKAQQGDKSSVEIEVDNKLASSPDPVKMTLDLTADVALRMESLEDAEAVSELREKLTGEWTVRDLAEALEVHRTNAYRRLKKLKAAGIVEQARAGKKGRIGGLARWYFVEEASSAEADDDDATPMPPQRHLN